MSWDYAFDIDGENPLDYCQAVIVESEYGMAAASDGGFTQPGLHGGVYIPGQLYGPGDFTVTCIFRFTDENGLVNHTNGEAGHINENLSNMKRLMGKVDSQIVFTRTNPHEGVTKIKIKPGAEPSKGPNIYSIMFPMVADKPFWYGTAINTTLTGAFTPQGNAPIDDAVLTFAGAGSVTNNRNGDKIQVTAACVVNCGTRKVTVGGSPAPGLIIPNNERWMHIEPGVNSITGSCSISYNPKWK